jgi:hypothetical protein
MASLCVPWWASGRPRKAWASAKLGFNSNARRSARSASPWRRIRNSTWPWVICAQASRSSRASAVRASAVASSRTALMPPDQTVRRTKTQRAGCALEGQCRSSDKRALATASGDHVRTGSPSSDRGLRAPLSTPRSLAKAGSHLGHVQQMSNIRGISRWTSVDRDGTNYFDSKG